MAENEKSAWKELWSTFFSGLWPMWVGGILLGFLNVCLFIVKSPWGGSGTYINWGQNIYQSLHIMATPHLSSILEHRYGLLGLMTLLGAFVAALMAKQFSVRIPPTGELIKGFLGGILMAIGATAGAGCTIGGFFSGWPALSAGALFLSLGLLIGAIISFRYLLWEGNNLPIMNKGKRFIFFASKPNSGHWQPILGSLLAIFLIVGAAILFSGNNVLTWFAIIGLFLGMICQRSQFCIVRAFREPFMTGMSEGPIGVSAGLMVGIIGFTVIKYMGMGASTPEEARILALTWVNSNFWMRGLIGGTVFGLGMVIAGGCAVGTLWRAGEGQVKLWFSAIGFLLMAPISKKFIVPAFVNALPDWGKQKVFLPDWVGYGGAVVIFTVIIVFWYIFVKWNERTERFSAV